MLKGVGFEVLDVTWSYRPATSAEGAEQIPSGVRSLDARCNNCLHRWHADPSATDEPGHFHSLVGWMTLTCPACGHQDTVEAPHPH